MTSSSLQRIIGLTGGVGMGKTTVSTYLATQHHLPVLDADIYAREAVEPGSPILGAIAARYGSDILLPDGTLNRRRIGELVFSDPAERQWLEQQIHPYVRDRFHADLERLKQQSQSTVVLVIPLLFEANMADLVSEVWVVYCPLEQQKARLQERDRLTPDQVQARINSQMAIDDKLKQADVVLKNDSTLEALLRQVDAAIDR